MLPVFNKPLIKYTINFLKNKGLEEIIIALSREEKIPTCLDTQDINIRYYQETHPRGTAGILGDLREFLEKDPFLVINGNLFIEDINLIRFFEFHYKKSSVATVGVYKDAPSGLLRENINIADDKTVKGFYIIHSSMDKRTSWKPSGIYLFDPSILKFIDRENYMDIKEQLLPLLQKEGLNVFAYETEGFYLNINRVRDYVQIHRDILLKRDNYKHYFKDKEMLADNIWVGRDVTISPHAYLLGPIIIGDNCTIDSGSQIIGPAVIGNNCHLSARTLVRESILWNKTFLADNSKIEYSILGENTYVSKGQNLKNVITVNGLQLSETNLLPPNYTIKGVVDLNNKVFHTGIKYKSYLILKRLMDITLSSMGLILSLPLFLIIAIAIKIDSPGKVFFIQRRSGKDGKEFKMIKFRTMIANAEELQKKLSSKKDVDGPMFKLANDPRITRIGKILRKTSLDELPQLLNVLKGEMSLVGPRPLVMEEMKFSPSWRDTRLKVKPGLTGLWQIQGRSETPFHEWIKYDVYYVKHQSLWLDIKILLKTIKVVLTREGAY